MIRRFLFILVASLAFISCKNNSGNTSQKDTWPEVYKNAYTNHDYVTAVVALNHLIITDSANRPNYYDSLSVYYLKKLRNYSAGKKAIDAGLALSPNNYQLLEYKSIFLTAENKLEEARVLLQKAYKLSNKYKYMYMCAATYAEEKNFDEYNKIANQVLYNPNIKPERVEVPVDETVTQFVELKAYCYLDKAKISTNRDMVMKYTDSALMIDPNYQEAMFIKQKLMGGNGQ